MSKKAKLGRGLDILLKSSYTPKEGDTALLESTNERLEEMAVNLLQRGKFQPRDDINPETLEQLSQSIKAQGIIQPIVAREVATNQYEIIAGERRWRAAQLAGLKTVPVIVRDISDQVAVAIGLIENIQREGLTPLEEANALQKLIEEFAMTHNEVASAVGRSRSAVTNLIRLLQLNDSVKKLLNNGDIQMGHGRALLSIPNEQQFKFATTIIEKDLSVRQAEQLINTNNPSKKEQVKTKEAIKNNVLLEEFNKKLTKKFNTSIKIQQNNKGKGKIIINYNNIEELKTIISKIEN
jgi:ParB family chromosome partitioning protein